MSSGAFGNAFDNMNERAKEIDRYKTTIRVLTAERDKYKAERDELMRVVQDIINYDDTMAMKISLLHKDVSPLVNPCFCCDSWCSNYIPQINYKRLYDIEHRRRVAAEKMVIEPEALSQEGYLDMIEYKKDYDIWQSIIKEAGE